MKFKDLKEGMSIYVLDKQKVEYIAEKVNAVSMPHIDAKMSAMGMVVDITTDSGTYCMAADSEVAYPCNRVITTDRQNILREIEAMRDLSQQMLSQVDRHKEMVTKCNQLISELDPVQKEKQQMESRISGMEESIKQMMEMLKRRDY